MDEVYATLQADLSKQRLTNADDYGFVKLVLQEDWYYPCVLGPINDQKRDVGYIEYTLDLWNPTTCRYSDTESTIAIAGTTAIDMTALTAVETPLILEVATTDGVPITLSTSLGAKALTITPTVTGTLKLDMLNKIATRTTLGDASNELRGLWPDIKFIGSFDIVGITAGDLKYRAARL